MLPANLERLFDRVAVISLDRRPERWKSFLVDLPADWPFTCPVRFPAIDGSQHAPPPWWKEGAGAWGCYLSHVTLIQDALEDGIDSILILEDDALFSPNFATEVRTFIAALPDDWKYIFFGGQHIELHHGIPTQVNQWVYRPYNVNRTHAYGIRGRDMLQKIYEHLVDTENWTAKHHVDHHLGAFHKKTDARHTYVPWRWLVAQGGGDSDVAQQARGFRAFLNAEDIVFPQVSLPMVAVLGPYSGGTSAVAGVLHQLGISMGQHFEKPDATNHAGNFEALELANLCRRMFTEPWLAEQLNRQTRSQLLKIWAAGHCQASRLSSSVVGGKHPLLCLMGAELEEAWNRPFIISVERKLQDVVNSLTRRNWGWSVEACMQVSESLITAREYYLATSTATLVLRLGYNELISHTAASIDKICAFLDFKPTSQARQAATEFVRSP